MTCRMAREAWHESVVWEAACGARQLRPGVSALQAEWHAGHQKSCWQGNRHVWPMHCPAGQPAAAGCETLQALPRARNCG